MYNILEFRRIDSNGDNALTFTEFLLGDRPYIETQSRNFHNLDKNSDGRVSREEFETFYRQQDEIHRRLRTDGFFKQLVSIYLCKIMGTVPVAECQSFQDRNRTHSPQRVHQERNRPSEFLHQTFLLSSVSLVCKPNFKTLGKHLR